MNKIIYLDFQFIHLSFVKNGVYKYIIIGIFVLKLAIIN